MVRSVALTLCLAVFDSTLPAPTTLTERETYQQREAQSKSLEDFEGGFLAELIVLTAVVIVVAFIVWVILDCGHHGPMVSGGTS